MKNLLSLIDIETESNIAYELIKFGIFDNIHSFVDMNYGAPKSLKSIHFYNIYNDWNSIIVNTDYSSYSLLEQAEEYKDSFIKILDRWIIPKSNKTNYLYLSDLYSKYLFYCVDFLEDNEITDIFVGIPHVPITYGLFVAAKLKKVRILFKHHLPVNNTDSRQMFFFTRDMDGRIDYNIDELCLNNSHYIQNYYNLSKSKTLLKKKFSFKELILHIRRILKAIYSVFYRFNRLLYYLLLLMRFDISLKRYYKKNSLPYDSINKKSFIYFPLHLQPEATTNPMASKFLNQFELSFNIANAIPNDCYLVIKEHPAYWTNLPLRKRINDSRALYDYKLMSNHDKIILADYNIDSELLIKSSLGVISLSGSVIFESFLMKKKALVLGKSFYINLPNTIGPLENNNFQQTLTTFLNYEIKNYSVEDFYNYITNGFVCPGHSPEEKYDYAMNVIKVYLNVWNK